ncbi:MAG: hypothetical protein ACOY93_02410 [Bacillota bacterium]
MAKENGYPVHEGPMADRRGTGWREDAAKLEAINQRRIENPMQTPPSNLTTIDKEHAFRAKSDEGSYDQNEIMAGGDTVRGEE